MKEDTYIKTLEKVDISVDGETYELVAASFRGVSFFVDTYSQGGLGRTIAIKKVPFSNRRIYEDLGGNIPTHSLNIYLIGDDCDVQKQNLIDACGQEGLAEFVHPWLGKFNARISNLSFSATKKELGYVKGVITVEQEDDLPKKVVAISPKAKSVVEAHSIILKKKKSFIDRFDTLKNIKGFVDKAVAISEKILDKISEARRSLNEINEFVNEVGKFKANLEVAIQTPYDFANRFENIISTTAEIFGIETDKKDDVEEYASIVENTDSSEIGDYVRVLSLSCMVMALVEADFSSVEEAKDYQDRVSSVFDIVLDKTDVIEDYMSLSSLKALCLSYLRDSMQNMAVIVEKNVQSSCNILTLSYDVYGGTDRIEEIMERNCFSQGLFITPCRVKVLSK